MPPRLTWWSAAMVPRRSRFDPGRGLFAEDPREDFGLDLRRRIPSAPARSSRGQDRSLSMTGAGFESPASHRLIGNRIHETRLARLDSQDRRLSIAGAGCESPASHRTSRRVDPGPRFLNAAAPFDSEAGGESAGVVHRSNARLPAERRGFDSPHLLRPCLVVPLERLPRCRRGETGSIPVRGAALVAARSRS